MGRSQQITRLENQRDAQSGLKFLEELKEEEEEEHVRIVTVVFSMFCIWIPNWLTKKCGFEMFVFHPYSFSSEYK